MGIQHKSDQAAVPPAGVVLEKLYRDAALTRYDVFAVDALDPQSWPKQANPVAGDLLIDISPADGASATLTAPAMTFNGGFIADGASIQKIDLPAVSCRPAATSRGNIAITWVYITAQPNQVRKLFGWLRSGPAVGSWGAHLAGAANGLQVVVFADGASGTVTLPASGLYMFAMGRVEDGNGGFLSRRRVVRSDGTVVSATGAASAATAAQPANAPSTIGGDSTFGNSAIIRFYRQRMIDVKEVAGVSSAAWFDAVVDAEFALNKARAEWILP